MKRTAFVASPLAAAAAAGGASWFLGGAIADMGPAYAGAAAAGALVGTLILLPCLRAAEKELAARAEEARKARVAQAGSRPAAARGEAQELRELVGSLARLLKTAEEVETTRAAELERASQEAREALSEAQRCLEAARSAVAGAVQRLAAVEGGGESVQDVRD